MKENFSIFYSWQSDIRKNRNFIQTSIEKAIKSVIKKQDKKIELKINIDRDTQNISGSPAIANTIFQKISTSDIFVCDITVINKFILNKFFKRRFSPNPNVLIELGYAVSVLGWERIICINDTKYSAIEELPFDIRGHRITTFNSTNQPSKESLNKILTKAIESIIINYDYILSGQLKNSNKIHDLNIYRDLERICTETLLLDSISLVVNSLFINKYYLNIWDSIQEFYNLAINQFIDGELDGLMKDFLRNLNEFDIIVTTKFHSNSDDDPTFRRYLFKSVDGEALTEEEEFEYQQSQTYIPQKEPFRNETWPKADRRIQKLQDTLHEQGEKVKSSYRRLVMKIKQKLM